ncbi:MAG: hypothetical protein ABIE84_05505 [bacterium]
MAQEARENHYTFRNRLKYAWHGFTYGLEVSRKTPIFLLPIVVLAPWIGLLSSLFYGFRNDGRQITEIAQNYRRYYQDFQQAELEPEPEADPLLQ